MSLCYVSRIQIDFQSPSSLILYLDRTTSPLLPPLIHSPHADSISLPLRVIVLLISLPHFNQKPSTAFLVPPSYSIVLVDFLSINSVA